MIAPPDDTTNDRHQISPASSEPLIIDALHQYAYCPRRMHLMHVDGLMAHNHFTADGTWVHRRVDAVDDVLPLPSATGDDPPAVLCSVHAH